jgi:hypothetical protein
MLYEQQVPNSVAESYPINFGAVAATNSNLLNAYIFYVVFKFFFINTVCTGTLFFSENNEKEDNFNNGFNL